MEEKETISDVLSDVGLALADIKSESELEDGRELDGAAKENGDAEDSFPRADGESEDESASDTDYESIIEEDLKLLAELFPELRGISDISELDDPMRYGALRDLGLSAEEAYRAVSKRQHKPDNRSHLKSSAPRAAASPASYMSYSDMRLARELFGDISDAEIQRLYKKVTR